MNPQRKRITITLPARSTQQGITLIVGLIMLMLISVMVATAYSLSSTNIKAVGNMQFRDEVIAAANKAIEHAIGEVLFTGVDTLPTNATNFPLDINNDGVSDYTVAVAIPQCLQSMEVTSSADSGGSSESLGGSSFTASVSYFDTLWDITAIVTDAVSGASVEIHQGLRMPLTAAQNTAICPPTPPASS